jgi:hypothetical protein
MPLAWAGTSTPSADLTCQPPGAAGRAGIAQTHRVGVGPILLFRDVAMRINRWLQRLEAQLGIFNIFFV